MTTQLSVDDALKNLKRYSTVTVDVKDDGTIIKSYTVALSDVEKLLVDERARVEEVIKEERARIYRQIESGEHPFHKA